MMVILTTMWYIWKARNERRFHNKSWTVWQVHHAVAAGIAANLHQAHQQGNQDHKITLLLGPSTYQGMGLLATGSGADDVHESRHLPMLMQTLPSPPWYRVQLPALLPGTRCYTDASTSPDMQQQVRRTAGLGVLIVNNHQ